MAKFDSEKFEVLNSNSDPFHPVVKDYVEPSWVKNSFNFDGTNNVFAGDSTASSVINSLLVGANKKFTINIWGKLNASGTQILFCRDKSSATTARQFLIFNNTNSKFQVTLFTNSTNSVAWTATTAYSETREWNLWTIVYDGTQAATSRITVYRNAIAVPGSAAETGTFTTINNISSPNINIGGREDAATFGNVKIAQISIYNTNLSAARVATVYNTRVPFDERTQGTNDLILFLSADQSASFSTNWTWTDLSGGAVFTSAGMVEADKVNDTPALKQITVIGLHGQSNAVGRVKLWQLPSYLRGSLNWLKVWDGTNFVNINSTTNNNQYIETNQGEFGPEYYIAEYLNRRYAKTIYCFKVALGGTSLAYQGNGENWRYPDGDQGLGGQMYIQLNSTDVPDLREWELANGYTITKFRFVWIQGEADSGNSTDAGNYSTNEVAFLTHATYGIFTLLIADFYIQPKYYSTLLSSTQTNVAYRNNSTINAQKEVTRLTDTTNYRTINTDAVLTQTDLAHFNEAGMRTLANLIGASIDSDGI